MGTPFGDKEFRTANYKGTPMTCVGVAMGDGQVGVRNTNDPAKVTALFNNEEWQRFIDGVKRGEFDLKPGG